MTELSNKYVLIESPNRYEGRRGTVIDRIGLHCTQTPNSSGRGVVAYFKKKSSKASAHAVVDVDEVLCAVKAEDTAWAMQKQNQRGYHVEICGYAQWTKDQWLNGPGKQVMIWGACVVAEAISLCRYLGSDIQVRYLTDDEIRKGTGKGIVQHQHSDRVLKDPNPHTDLGLYFPTKEFLDMVKWWMPRIKEIRIQ